MEGWPHATCCSSQQELRGSSPNAPACLRVREPPSEAGVSAQPSSHLPALLLAGPPVLPPCTCIAFIHADVEVAAEGRGVDDAVGNLVVGRGVFICCLEGRGWTEPCEPEEGGWEEGWSLSAPPSWVIRPSWPCSWRLLSGAQQTRLMLSEELSWGIWRAGWRPREKWARPGLTQGTERVSTTPGRTTSSPFRPSLRILPTEAFPDLETGLGPCAVHPIGSPDFLYNFCLPVQTVSSWRAGTCVS